MAYQLLILALVSMTTVHLTRQPAPPVGSQASALADFQARVAEFALLHERLAKEAGELNETRSQAEIAERAVGLAKALQAARLSAKQGDVFTPAAGRILRDLIRREYRLRTPAVKESRQDAQDEVPNFIPKVNMLYPTTFPLGTFPASLLKVLPPLPPQLEYRIVTHYLVLRDVEANLIIDVLPNAIRQE